MILEVALAGALVAGAGIARAWWARRRNAVPLKRLALAAASSPKPTRGAGLWPGDVVQVFSEDFALEGCTEVSDGDFFVRVFEVVADARCIVQTDRLGEQLFIGKVAEVFEGRVPDTKDTGGRLLTLLRRGTSLHAIRRESLAPLPFGKVEYVLLGDKGGQRLLVLDSEGSRVALTGELLHMGSVTILPGSSST